MVINEILSKSVLTKTGIPGYDYCINPYVGCAHGCTYCYASFMKRFTGHREAWGEFVDVKINAPERLYKQLQRARNGDVLIGTVTDPYQPAEKTYRLTKGCLEALLEKEFSVQVLTRSPLCLRDMDLLKAFRNIQIGFSIGTDSEDVKRAFEPASPSIGLRLKALRTLHDAGIRTSVFIGPLLPLNPGKLVDAIAGISDYALIDRMNYSRRVVSIYRRLGKEAYLSNDYFSSTAGRLKEALEKRGIPTTILFA